MQTYFTHLLNEHSVSFLVPFASIRSAPLEEELVVERKNKWKEIPSSIMHERWQRTPRVQYFQSFAKTQIFVSKPIVSGFHGVIVAGEALPNQQIVFFSSKEKILCISYRWKFNFLCACCKSTRLFTHFFNALDGD